MIETIIGEGIVEIIMALSLTCGLLLGIGLTILFYMAYQEGEKKRKARARVMCPTCSKRYLDLLKNE